MLWKSDDLSVLDFESVFTVGKKFSSYIIDGEKVLYLLLISAIRFQ